LNTHHLIDWNLKNPDPTKVLLDAIINQPIFRAVLLLSLKF